MGSPSGNGVGVQIAPVSSSRRYITSPGASETGSFDHDVSLFIWLLPDQVYPKPASVARQPKLSFAMTLLQGAGGRSGFADPSVSTVMVYSRPSAEPPHAVSEKQIIDLIGVDDWSHLLWFRHRRLWRYGASDLRKTNLANCAAALTKLLAPRADAAPRIPRGEGPACARAPLAPSHTPSPATRREVAAGRGEVVAGPEPPAAMERGREARAGRRGHAARPLGVHFRGPFNASQLFAWRRQALAKGLVTNRPEPARARR